MYIMDEENYQNQNQVSDSTQKWMVEPAELIEKIEIILRNKEFNEGSGEYETKNDSASIINDKGMTIIKSVLINYLDKNVRLSQYNDIEISCITTNIYTNLYLELLPTIKSITLDQEYCSGIRDQHQLRFICFSISDAVYSNLKGAKSGMTSKQMKTSILLKENKYIGNEPIGGKRG